MYQPETAAPSEPVSHATPLRIARSAGDWVSFQLHREALERFIPRGSRVLEVSAGAGHYTEALHQLGCKISVLDESLEELESNQARAQARGFTASIEGWAQRDICSLGDYPDATFDAVVAYGAALSHALDRRDRALGECMRVLRPRGILVLDAYSLWGSMRRNLPQVLARDLVQTRAIIRSGNAPEAVLAIEGRASERTSAPPSREPPSREPPSREPPCREPPSREPPSHTRVSVGLVQAAPPPAGPDEVAATATDTATDTVPASPTRPLEQLAAVPPPAVVPPAVSPPAVSPPAVSPPAVSLPAIPPAAVPLSPSRLAAAAPALAVELSSQPDAFAPLRPQVASAPPQSRPYSDAHRSDPHRSDPHRSDPHRSDPHWREPGPGGSSLAGAEPAALEPASRIAASFRGERHCHLFRAAELEAFLRRAGLEVLSLSASSALSTGVEMPTADPGIWSTLLEYERAACLERGYLDSGHHLIAIARR